MMRKCHLNTCPVGVATQDPELRKRFTGKPEHVERFCRFIAQDLREIMAELGFRTIDEMIGRVDRLDAAAGHRPLEGPRAWTSGRSSPPPLADAKTATRCVRPQDHELEKRLDHELLRLAAPALERREPVHIEMPIRNIHRTVGATLSGEIVKRYGAEGLPDDTIRLSFKGSAGQSLGAFLAPGVTIRVEGDANDYLGKGMSGGRIILVPPRRLALPAARERHRRQHGPLRRDGAARCSSRASRASGSPSATPAPRPSSRAWATTAAST